jgi:hypothetical protein
MLKSRAIETGEIVRGAETVAFRMSRLAIQWRVFNSHR